jgi:hypothetical protein
MQPSCQLDQDRTKVAIVKRTANADAQGSPYAKTVSASRKSLRRGTEVTRAAPKRFRLTIRIATGKTWGDGMGRDGMEPDGASILDRTPKKRAREVRTTAKVAWLWVQVV